MLASDWKNRIELKTKIPKARKAFNKKKNLVCSSMDLEMRKELVKFYV